MASPTDAERSADASEISAGTRHLHLNDRDEGNELHSITSDSQRHSATTEDYASPSPGEALYDAILANAPHVAEHQVKARGARIRLNDVWCCARSAPSMLPRILIMAREQGLDINDTFRPPGSWPMYCLNTIITNATTFKALLDYGGMDLDRKAGPLGAMNARRMPYTLPTESEPLIPFIAILKAPQETIELLLDHGMRLDNCSPLHQVFSRRSLRVEYPANGPDDSIEILQLLLDHGCDINALEYAGNAEVQEDWGDRERGPPLHAAIEASDPRGFEFLLSHGADSMIKSTEGLNTLEKIDEWSTTWTDDLELQESMREMKNILSTRETGKGMCA